MLTTAPIIQEEKWVVIGKKGVITLPKSLRDTLGIYEGEITKIKIVGNSIVIEPKKEVEGKIVAKSQANQRFANDELPPDLAKETEDYWNEQGLL